MALKPETTTDDTATAPTVIKTVKGFNRDLTCRGFQFEQGKTYTIEGHIKACKNGFHACENALDVFAHYSPALSVFHEVEQSGEIGRHDDDTKIASATITIGVELHLSDVIKRGVDWILSKVDFENAKESNTGYRSAATNTGYQSAATNTGDQSAAEVSGNGSVAIATGYRSKAKAGEGGAICLVCRDDDRNILAIRASKVGENGLKPNIFYSLTANGEFVEVEDAQ